MMGKIFFSLGNMIQDGRWAKKHKLSLKRNFPINLLTSIYSNQGKMSSQGMAKGEFRVARVV